jgi:phage terminase large subunit
MTEVRIPYDPRPKQQDFHRSSADECFFGGAKGPGKSCALVMEAFAYALEYPGSDPHLFRETYDELEANLIKEFRDRIPESIATYNESKHEAHLHNGSVVKFRYVGSEKDAKHYDGRSIPWIGIDELTHHAEATIQLLMSCNRSAKGFPVRFRATGNPGNIGHSWVKKRYIVSTEYGKHIAVDPVTKNTIQFIPANVYDGVLTEADPKYVNRLENLPESKRRAFLLGDWDVNEGQFFAMFNPQIMAEDAIAIPPHLLDGRLHGGFDFGWGKDGFASFGMWYGDNELVQHRLFTWYRRGMGAQQQADDLYDYIESFHFTGGVFPSIVWYDNQMDNKGNLTADDWAPIDYFLERWRKGGKVTKWIAANKARVNGWQVVEDYLTPDVATGRPKMKYWRKYNDVWVECMQQLPPDPNNPDDALKCSIDHPADETRYFAVGIRGRAAGIADAAKHVDRSYDAMNRLISKMQVSETGLS